MNNNITGWRDVFSFTFIQTLKSKAFIISYVLVLIIALVSIPVVNIINPGNTDELNTLSSIQKVYINNETELNDIDLTELQKNEMMSHIVFEEIDKSTNSEAADNIGDGDVILSIMDIEGVFYFDFSKKSRSGISDYSMQMLSQAVVEQFKDNRINKLGITEEQFSMINSQIHTNVSWADINDAPIMEEDTSISNNEYWYLYGLLFVVLIVNIMASTQIATSIVTEKSTRVVEYLLMSVKPLALMIGKILAMLSLVLAQIISLIVILFASNSVAALLFSDNGDSILSQTIPTDILQNLNIINILFCLILIILGMFFYAALAGLAGATISRLEELGEGLILFTLTNMAGMYIGLGAANVLMISGMNGFIIFSFLFPLSSPFILPGAILLGKASVPLIAGAIILQIVFIFVLLRFVAKVYETLILHNGNKIKVTELIKISKSLSKGAV